MYVYDKSSNVLHNVELKFTIDLQNTFNLKLIYNIK